MRDHLLGCQAFLPPEPEEHINSARAKPFALGIPRREYRAYEDQMIKAIEAKQKITAFEDFDNTPEHMRNDFPREYDLQTMLNEAAGRFGYSVADLTLERNFSAFLADYDAEMRRLCGL